MQASGDDARGAGQIAPLLLDWYDRHARTLPWRSPPGSNAADPYHVWLSEIMLQQTTTAAVARYFARFTHRWPTVEALAAATDDEVMGAWAGLGYYARGRNLIAAARQVASAGGRFPDDETDLRGLPGVGAYTAAAIAAIAFGRRAVVIDANVARVVARLFAISRPLPAAGAELRQAADSITPDARPGDFAQAMMDLGATICTARAGPDCPRCPLRAACRGFAEGMPQAYPVKQPKLARPIRRGRAYWIERDGRVWLVRRPDRGLLGGMRALPDDGWSARADGDGHPPLAGHWKRQAGPVQHVFTHFSLELQPMVLMVSARDAAGMEHGDWWPIEGLDDCGLPTVFAKAARRVLEARHDP